MSDQDYGVLLHDADDVLPLGLVGTPWEIIFKALRDVMKSGVGASDSDFMRKACALYFLARGDLEAVTDRDVLNGIAAALVIPFWVENFDDPKQASAVLYNWTKYKPTRANLTALALASGMRAFRLREIYTSTEFGISHTFGFDLGEGYETSFFAGPNAEPGLATAQRICGALTHFFLRIKDSPTLIVDTTYPDDLPHGAKFYFRQNQSEIKVLQGYNWDLYDENGQLAKKIDEYAYYIPSVTRNLYGVNTDIVSPTQLIFLDDGQIRVSWGQPSEYAYALFAEVDINIPDKTCCWLSVNHIDVNLAPNAIPGATLFDEMGEPITGEHWEIFAAYNQSLERLDVSALYLSGTDPVRIRANRYMSVCQVWLSDNTPPGPVLPTVSILSSTSLGWCCVSSYPTATSLGVNASADLYDKTGGGEVLDRIPYDSTKSYSLLQWQTVAQTLAGRIEVAIESDASGYMVAKNVSSSTISFLQARIFVCSSNQATVVHVLDSSNVAYNAFKYTAYGVDYYYVLDATQTDWTDDLSSIGYHLYVPSDEATGSISSLTLPTAHNGRYTDVTFESLRYYAKGTLSETGYTPQATIFGIYSAGGWYYGTLTWTDESLGDLSSVIDVADPSSSNASYQTILRLHFIVNGPISGWHADDALGGNYGGQIAAYNYSAGVHSVTFYSPGSDWYSGAYSGRIMLRYIDETTTFKNLSSFDLIDVQNGVLSKLTTTDRYNMYSTWAGNITIKAYYAESIMLTVYLTSNGSEETNNTTVAAESWLELRHADGSLSPDLRIFTNLFTLQGAYLKDGSPATAEFYGDAFGRYSINATSAGNSNSLTIRTKTAGQVYKLVVRVQNLIDKVFTGYFSNQGINGGDVKINGSGKGSVFDEDGNGWYIGGIDITNKQVLTCEQLNGTSSMPCTAYRSDSDDRLQIRYDYWNYKLAYKATFKLC